MDVSQYQNYAVGAVAFVVFAAAAYFIFRGNKSRDASALRPAPAPAPPVKPEDDKKPEAAKPEEKKPEDDKPEPHDVAVRLIQNAESALHSAADNAKSDVDHVREGAKKLSEAAGKLLEGVGPAMDAAKTKFNEPRKGA